LIWAQCKEVAQGGGASVDKLHDKARRAIESGEEKFRDAAEYLARSAEARRFPEAERESNWDVASVGYG
jgi:hypothetical protein